MINKYINILTNWQRDYLTNISERENKDQLSSFAFNLKNMESKLTAHNAIILYNLCPNFQNVSTAGEVDIGGGNGQHSNQVTFL